MEHLGVLLNTMMMMVVVKMMRMDEWRREC
jgi:hypothetical protein